MTMQQRSSSAVLYVVSDRAGSINARSQLWNSNRNITQKSVWHAWPWLRRGVARWQSPRGRATRSRRSTARRRRGRAVRRRRGEGSARSRAAMWTQRRERGRRARAPPAPASRPAQPRSPCAPLRARGCHLEGLALALDVREPERTAGRVLQLQEDALAALAEGPSAPLAQPDARARHARLEHHERRRLRFELVLCVRAHRRDHLRERLGRVERLRGWSARA